MPNNGVQGAPDKKMCPLLGMVAVPEITPPKIHQFGGEPQMSIGIRFNVCVESQCMFWDAPKKDCTIRMGAESINGLKSLVDEHKGKLSLLSLFQKKG